MPQHMLPLTRNDRPPTIFFPRRRRGRIAGAVPVRQPHGHSASVWCLVRHPLLCLMIRMHHPAQPLTILHAASGAVASASRRPGAAAVSGHDELHRPGLRTLPSSGAVHRPAAAGSSCLPGPLHGHLSQPHRIRPALLPGLVRRARPGPAGRAGTAPGAIYPVDARDPPVQALHRIPPVLRHGRSYRTCVLDGVLEHSPAEHVGRPSVPAESPPWASRTCSSRPCSPRPGNHRTHATSRWWPCSACSACGSSRPPARTSPTSARSTATGSCASAQGHQDRPGPAAACRRPGHRPATGHRDRGPILLNTRGTRMDRHAATRRLHRLAEAAGIQAARAHPHMLRHICHDHARRRR